MTRISPNYGRRGRQNSANTGVRHLARTYGKAKIGIWSPKGAGHLIVESEPERFVAHLLTVDPRVTAFQPQPFTVDLVGQRLLRTPEEVSEAAHRLRDFPGPKFYTPDFGCDWQHGLKYSIEVKAEGYEGDRAYWAKVARARLILAANAYPLRTIVYPANSAHPVRMNARLLKQATHSALDYVTAPLIEQVTARCEQGAMSVSSLCQELALPPGMIPLLLVRGVLSADLVRYAICGNLEVSNAYGDLSHLCLLEEMER